MKLADWIIGLLGAILLVDQTQIVDAIYKDDVGVLDFSVATAGHGAVGFASQQGELFSRFSHVLRHVASKQSLQ